MVNVYGSIYEPLIKCSDLLIHVLGYRKSHDAHWFRNIRNNSKFIIEGDTPS